MAATAPSRKSFWARWGWRGLVPAGGLAAACLLALHLANPGTASAEFVPELELASDDMGAYTYRNQEDGLTMIWLYDRPSGAQSQSAQSSTPAILGIEMKSHHANGPFWVLILLMTIAAGDVARAADSLPVELQLIWATTSPNPRIPNTNRSDRRGELLTTRRSLEILL